MHHNKHGWTKLNESSLKRHFELLGHDASKIKRELNRIQIQDHVDEVTVIAGYKKGLYRMHGAKILIIRGPDLLTAVEGAWPLVEQCLKRLMLSHPAQYPILLSWLSQAVKNLYNEDIYIPGQILFLLGPVHCGKSLLQSIITWLLGDRSCRPYDSLTGETSFNSDSYAHEHQIIADPPIRTSIDRLAFAAHLKQYAVEEDHRHHRKGIDAIMIRRPKQRLSVAANDELHNVIIVPTLEKSFEDKCIVLKCEDGALPLPGYENMERTAFEKLIRAELPAFLHFLLNYQIPAELRQKPHCSRFGLDSWHHPELAAMINSQSQEQSLMNVLDSSFFMSGSDPWEGNHKDLAQALYAIPDDPEARKFSRSPWLIARCLVLLSNQYPDRVKKSKRRKNEWGKWKIFPETKSGEAR